MSVTAASVTDPHRPHTERLNGDIRLGNRDGCLDHAGNDPDTLVPVA